MNIGINVRPAVAVFLSNGGELFFHGRRGVDGLHHWLIRELRETDYELVVWRDGKLERFKASYVLGPYDPPGET